VSIFDGSQIFNPARIGIGLIANVLATVPASSATSCRRRPTSR
jgi:hypothetical protein